ncbi:MAG TPA: phospholipase D-like domain-containing protein [Solirubrobacterales bacterium]|nr:phospholipase D-like domain-containing protein [Solirubrobacterales bacterium]
MEEAVALANNDVVLLAWSYEEPISDCLGFAIRRREAGGVTIPLPAWIGFHGESNPDWDPRDTEEWPIQKFSWRDLTGTWGHTYSYEIVPRTGKPGDLQSAEDRVLKTDEVTLTPICSTNVSAYFNRGILSTQALAHALPKNEKGVPDGHKLIEHIETPGDPLREALAGQIVEGLTLLLKGATRDDSSCLGAIYELNDPELVAQLTDPERVSLVLSEAGEDDSTNDDARRHLHEGKVDVADRLFHTNAHLGHNKFLIKQAADGTPTSILTGSTNWTRTGICAQANNALILSDGPLAAAYRAYWEKLKAECPPDPKAKATQSPGFRTGNDEPHEFTIDGADVTLWFSPNTQQQNKPDNPPAPGDMEQVFKLIRGAKEGVLFLLFQPGSPCILDAIGEAQKEKPELFVRGAATDTSLIEKYEAKLYQEGVENPQVAAAAVPDDPIGSMQKELLKTPGAHAIIHDKIVVIDPRSADCKVITGSHNLGYKASYANDENLLIIEGHQRLAEAYATHVMDVYEHYRWRWRTHGKQSGDGDSDPEDGSGLSNDDSWQDDYFGDVSAEAERTFWL